RRQGEAASAAAFTRATPHEIDLHPGNVALCVLLDEARQLAGRAVVLAAGAKERPQIIRQLFHVGRSLGEQPHAPRSTRPSAARELPTMSLVNMPAMFLPASRAPLAQWVEPTSPCWSRPASRTLPKRTGQWQCKLQLRPSLSKGC